MYLHLIIALLVPLLTFANHILTPTLPFTVAAFQSPYPPTASNSVTGLLMYSANGTFWFSRPNEAPKTSCGDLRGNRCPAGNETVLWVDHDGRAYLDSATPQPIYLDTRTGILSYLNSVLSPPNAVPAGANVVNFLHLGQGTNITSPIPGEDSNVFVNGGPGSFSWLGSDNASWFLCPDKGALNSYQVQKEVTVNSPAQASCLSGIALIAIDYSGPSPAAGTYL